MKWVEPQYSKEQVKKAGIYLLNCDVESKEFQESIPIFHNWRSAHAFPMQIMLDLLRKNTIRIDKGSFVVQRLKRVRSIFNKLMREENMSLSRMQGIAGCRAVVSDVRRANKVRICLKNSRTKNILHKEKDYIKHPKESGYRGIHLIYKYNGRKEAYNGMFVELQIRSKVQHSWATAVEVVGAFTRQALKASTGDSRWLDFFKYTSVEFTRLEKCEIDPAYKNVDTFNKMDELINTLDVSDRLGAFKVATKALTSAKEKGDGYFVLLLDTEEKVVNYSRFSKKQLTEATNFYDQNEEAYRGDPSKDVVLVSAASVRYLKKAYPNYFADTDDFEKYIMHVFRANKSSNLTSANNAPAS